MGRQYMKVGRNALFGVRNDNCDNICSEKVPRPLSLLISRKGRLRHGEQLFLFNRYFNKFYTFAN